MIPSIGRIVHYRIPQYVVDQINFQRTNNSCRGNIVAEGDVFPLIISKVWSTTPNETTAFNGQLILDGNDNIWVTSTVFGPGLAQCFEPPRV